MEDIQKYSQKKKKKQISIDTYYVLYDKIILIPKNKSLQVYKISMKNYKIQLLFYVCKISRNFRFSNF